LGEVGSNCVPQQETFRKSGMSTGTFFYEHMMDKNGPGDLKAVIMDANKLRQWCESASDENLRKAMDWISDKPSQAIVSEERRVRRERGMLNRPYPIERKTDLEILDNAKRDASEPYSDFLLQIYREAYNNDQNPDEKIAKLIAKFSALSVRITKDNEVTTRENLKIARWALGVGIFGLFVGGMALLVAVIQLIFGTAQK
jgi:hypothetical protein